MSIRLERYQWEQSGLFIYYLPFMMGFSCSFWVEYNPQGQCDEIPLRTIIVVRKFCRWKDSIYIKQWKIYLKMDLECKFRQQNWPELYGICMFMRKEVGGAEFECNHGRGEINGIQYILCSYLFYHFIIIAFFSKMCWLYPFFFPVNV